MVGGEVDATARSENLGNELLRSKIKAGGFMGWARFKGERY